MKFVDEFRDPQLAQQLVEQIHRMASRRWVLMDVCGGQTHSLLRYGIEEALNDSVELIHGPGCPVCVTPAEWIDRAQQLSLQPGVILATFGDMLRVPGSSESLLEVRARGGRVQIVYSPMDAVDLARQYPESQIVFFGVGFETTVPSTALAILQAERLALTNFTVLACHVRVLPVMNALMLRPENRVQGILAAGHVCTITGYEDYEEFASGFQVPVTIAGFEPLDLLKAILETIKRLECAIPEVVNCYSRSARPTGNKLAKATLEQTFEAIDFNWRGFGLIPAGGYRIRQAYGQFDAERRFGATRATAIPHKEACWSAAIMSGQIKPIQCPFFGLECTPDHPMGAPMVSSEGACAAYIRYQLPKLPADTSR